MNISIDLIDLPPALLRDDNPDVSDLLPTIADPEIGILQPLLLRPGEIHGRYTLIAGKRRLTAARLAGLTEVPAEVRDLTDSQARIAELVENLARRDLPAHREAEGVVELIRLRFEAGGMEVPTEEVKRVLWRLSNEKRGNVEARMLQGVEGETVMAVFEQIGRSFAAFVTGTLPAMSWPDDVRGAMERGLSKAAGQQLAQIKDPTLRADALARVQGGEKAKEVKAELLGAAADHARLERDLTDAERLEGWPTDDGWLRADLVLEVAEPSGMDVVPRAALVEETLARLGVEPGEQVVMIDAPLSDVIAALRAGVHVWSSSISARFANENDHTPTGGGAILLFDDPARGERLGLEDAPDSATVWRWVQAQEVRAARLTRLRDLKNLSGEPTLLIGVEATTGGANTATLSALYGSKVPV